MAARPERPAVDCLWGHHVCAAGSRCVGGCLMIAFAILVGCIYIALAFRLKAFKQPS